MWYGTSLVCCCSQHSSINLCDVWQPLLPSIIIIVIITFIITIIIIIIIIIIITIIITVITTKEQST